MATAEDYKAVKHPDNMPGKYWVDCAYCLRFGICVDTAPNNFRFPERDYFDDEHLRNGAYVYKQPETEEEEAQCRLALQICPVDVIHDDGQ